MSESEFKNDVNLSILKKYCSTSRGLTLRGFKQFWKHSIEQQMSEGNVAIWQWLENLGYDRDLYSVRSRVFILTLHCEKELAVTVRDSIQTDLDNRTNQAIITKYGQELESMKGIKTFYTFSE